MPSRQRRVRRHALRITMHAASVREATATVFTFDIIGHPRFAALCAAHHQLKRSPEYPPVTSASGLGRKRSSDQASPQFRDRHFGSPLPLPCSCTRRSCRRSRISTIHSSIRLLSPSRYPPQRRGMWAPRTNRSQLRQRLCLSPLSPTSLKGGVHILNPKVPPPYIQASAGQHIFRRYSGSSASVRGSLFWISAANA
jgi:hypothetical protein